MSNQLDDQDDPNAIPPEANDFATFDPETYLRERRAREGRSRVSEDLTRSDEETFHARRHSRGGRVESLESEIDDGSTEIPVGLTARLLGALSGGRGGEGVYMWGNILRELTPFIRRFLPLIGCMIVLACLAIGTAFYLLVSALTHR